MEILSFDLFLRRKGFKTHFIENASSAAMTYQDKRQKRVLNVSIKSSSALSEGKLFRSRFKLKKFSF